MLLALKLTCHGIRRSEVYEGGLTGRQKEAAARLRAIVTHLAENIGIRDHVHYDNLKEAAEYIARSFSELGYNVERQSYRVDGKAFDNIVARRPDGKKDGKIIVIGAHYDSCFNPGADDNASGVAGLLELAGRFRGRELDSNIQFVAFVNEEPPFFKTELMGSRVYARKLKEAGKKVKAAIVLEMIGYYTDEKDSQRYPLLLGLFYPNRGNFIMVVGNFRSAGLVRKIRNGFRRQSDFPIESIVAPSFIPGIDWSDHASFWKEGYPAVMITDTSYLRNEHYHQPTDLPGTLGYNRMAVMLDGLEKSIIKYVAD